MDDSCPAADVPMKELMEPTSQLAAGTVLVVDDNAMVSRLTCLMLRKAGYIVLAAEDSENALDLAATHPAPIDLLLTDVVMPNMGGLELAHRCQELRPNLQVLFVSGYADEATVKVGILDPGYAFLLKPFTYEELTDKVEALLAAALPI